MGTHASIFALSQGWPRDELAAGPFGDAARARAAAVELFPGRIGEDLGAATLDQKLWPEDSLWVATAGSTVLVTSTRLKDAVHLAHQVARGRRDTFVLMHSVSDYIEFSTSDGSDDDPAAREVTLHPEMSLEDADMFALGPELDFERPFWAGERYVGWEPEDQPEPDEVPFSPMSLGEEALRAFFGFTVEGDKLPDDLDPRNVVVFGFRWADGKNQGEPEAVELSAGPTAPPEPTSPPEPSRPPEPSPFEPSPPEPSPPEASQPEPSPPPSRSWWRRLFGRT